MYTISGYTRRGAGVKPCKKGAFMSFLKNALMVLMLLAFMLAQGCAQGGDAGQSAGRQGSTQKQTGTQAPAKSGSGTLKDEFRNY